MSSINVTPNGFIFIKNPNESVSFFTNEDKFYISIKKFKRDVIIEYEKTDLFLFQHMLNSFFFSSELNSNFIDVNLEFICKEIKDLIKNKDTK